MTSMRYGLIICVLSAIMIGCSNTPEYVIPHEKMVDLLVDIHIGESVVDVNRRDYRNDSLKKGLKQSILAKHNITQEQLDTSLVWYGHNLEEYLEVYDDVISQLEKDVKDAEETGFGHEELAVSIAGDSVDVWNGLRFRVYNENAPIQYLSFVLKHDDNTEIGDEYLWEFKMHNNRSSVAWTMAADYNDGTTDYTTGITSSNGWNRLHLNTDSAKMISRIYGTARIVPVKGEIVYIDSISLLRTRYDVKTYNKHSRQHSIGNKTNIR